MEVNHSTITAHALLPLPGVEEGRRIIVATDLNNQIMTILLPDDTQICISADRAVLVRGSGILTLSSWQFSQHADLESDQILTAEQREEVYSNTQPYRMPLGTAEEDTPPYREREEPPYQDDDDEMWRHYHASNPNVQPPSLREEEVPVQSSRHAPAWQQRRAAWPTHGR